MPCSIEVKNLSKSFGKICAVDNVSFTAYPSQIIALLGPNGAGKSTLMNMIVGYLSQSRGSIEIFGKNNEQFFVEAKKVIGFLPEGAPLYADMTVKMFLKYIIELKLSHILDENKKEKVEKELNRIVDVANINNVLNQRIDTLSKGYTRRVGFAQSIIGDPDILLLDEPTDGLDPNQKDHMKKLIKDMGKGKTIIVSTHLLDEAQSIANRIILINKGKIVADGSLKEILKQTKCSSLEDAFRHLTQNGE
jgi:ABC-2 type transport system ATP-binding protein